MRFCIVCLLTLLLSAVSLADTTVGTILDGYSYVGGGYWQDAAANYYTYHEYTGYKTTCYRGCAYQTPITYYYFKAASKPASSLTKDSSDSDFIKFLADRERIQGAIALDKQKSDSFLAKLKAVGVTPPFPGLPAYGNPFFGAYGATGSTLYGYAPSTYSVQTAADIYGPIDLNVLFQQSSALTKNAQGLATQANSEFNGLVDRANSGASEVAKIKAEGEVAVAKIRAVAPASRIRQTVSQTTADPVTMPKIADGDSQIASERFTAVVKASCLACHSNGGENGGKFDMTRGITDDQRLKMLARVALPDNDPKRMPPPGKGKHLTLAEIRAMAD